MAFACRPVLGVAAAAVTGLLLGSVSTADAVARSLRGRRVDLRESGSGNPGTVNATQLLGARAGAIVLAGDIGKAALAAGLGRRLAGPTGAHVAGVAAVVGHCHPVWPGRSGGKGVAASIGQVVVTFPAYLPIDAAVAGCTVAIPAWRNRAFGSIAVSTTCWVLASVVWWRRRWWNAWGPPPSVALPAAALVSSAVIIERFATSGEQAADRVTA